MNLAVRLLWTLMLVWMLLMCSCSLSAGMQQSHRIKRFSIKRIPSWILMPANKKLPNGRRPSAKNIEDYLDAIGADAPEDYNLELHEEGEDGLEDPAGDKEQAGEWHPFTQMSQLKRLGKRSRNFPTVQLGRRKRSLDIKDKRKQPMDIKDKPQKKKFPDTNWGKRSLDVGSDVKRKKFPDINWGKRQGNGESVPVSSALQDELQIHKKYSKPSKTSKIQNEMNQRRNQGFRQYSLRTNRIPSYKEKCLLAELRKKTKNEPDIQNTSERGKIRKNRKIFVRIG